MPRRHRDAGEIGGALDGLAGVAVLGDETLRVEGGAGELAPRAEAVLRLRLRPRALDGFGERVYEGQIVGAELSVASGSVGSPSAASSSTAGVASASRGAAA